MKTHGGPSRMTFEQIAVLGRKLSLFLALFADCFRGSIGRRLLRVDVNGQVCTAKPRRRLRCNSTRRRGRCNGFLNQSIGTRRGYEIDASRSWSKTTITLRPSVEWMSRARPRAARRRWGSVGHGTVIVGKLTTGLWEFLSAIQRRAFKCYWIAILRLHQVGQRFHKPHWCATKPDR